MMKSYFIIVALMVMDSMKLIQAGVPLSALQEMGGWESIEMVKRYAHLSLTPLQEHAKNIDEILSVQVTNIARKII